MERKTFLDALEVVEPAIAGDQATLPILTHLWFDKETVMAFNDVVALRAPLATPVAGAVPGHTLLVILRASTAREIAIEVGDLDVTVKVAGAKIKLPLLLPDAFIFEMPNPTKGAGFDVAPLLAPIEYCLHSVSTDPTKVEQRGITLVPEDNPKGISVFSTDNYTMRHSRVNGTFQGSRVILPVAFCKELLRLAPGKSAVMTIIDKDKALVRIGGIDLFTRLIKVEKPIPYHSALDRHLPKTKLNPLPRNLKMVVDRACLIANGEVTELTVSDGKATFFTSATSQITDVLKVDKAQADVAAIKLDCRYLKDVEAFDSWLITEGGVVMADKGRDFLYFIASSGDDED